MRRRKREGGVLGVFAEPAACAAAIRAFVERERRDLTVYSPFSDHRVVAALGRPVSPLGIATLIGAGTGTVSGIALAIFATYRYSFIVWGKPLLSWLPWVVVGFELTILFGALTNFAGMLIGSGLARFREPLHYDARFSVDHFGVFMPCGAGDREKYKTLLTNHGALEVHERD
jgi:molybdopterin-containing oxidoreductase family membrane subunit